MNKKKYKCGECGKTLIRNKLPHNWSIITTRSENKAGYHISYICDECKRRYREKWGYDEEQEE